MVHYPGVSCWKHHWLVFFKMTTEVYLKVKLPPSMSPIVHIVTDIGQWNTKHCKIPFQHFLSIYFSKFLNLLSGIAHPLERDMHWSHTPQTSRTHPISQTTVQRCVLSNQPTVSLSLYSKTHLLSPFEIVIGCFLSGCL